MADALLNHELEEFFKLILDYIKYTGYIWSMKKTNGYIARTN